MGTLTLPPTGSIYLDTSAIIYSVERNEPYLALLAPAWQQAEAGQLVLVAAFRSVFAAPEVQVMPATRQLWEATARLRAQTGLKTPDALHAVTALEAECAIFVTNDADFRRVRGLGVTVLDDLLPAG